MKNEYRIFGFPRRFVFRYVFGIQKEKERTFWERSPLSPSVPYSIDAGHSINR